jgi:hypothetical protein
VRVECDVAFTKAEISMLDDLIWNRVTSTEIAGNRRAVRMLERCRVALAAMVPDQDQAPPPGP